MSAALLLAFSALASPQSVRLEVRVPEPRPGLRLSAETTWLDEARVLDLHDDGSAPGDLPGDGTWVGVWTGEVVRALPIRLYASATGVERAEVASGLEVIALEEDTIHWALEGGTVPRARRVAAAMTSRVAAMTETTGITAALGWAGLVLAYAGWLVGRSERPDPP